MARQVDEYIGFEQGPIRPPSEAYSLLIRITRNCPWNRCRFCSIYKGEKFTIRPVEHVIADIDKVHGFIVALSETADRAGRIYREDVSRLAGQNSSEDIEAFNAAVNWIASGQRSVFLQDANSPVIRPAYLIEILKHLKLRFPNVDRITSYARSHTLARIKPDDMKAIAEAGLNRIHVGLETGSDRLLALINKGSTKENHIIAGRNVIDAGIELSEYIMPGLGGQHLSSIHATETADTLNQINPDFIRLRTLLIPHDFQMFGDEADVPFVKLSDIKIVEEIKRFVESLSGIDSSLASDHNNNLLPAIQGKLSQDQDRMIAVADAFLALDPLYQLYFQIGRRFGFMTQTSDLNNPDRLDQAIRIRDQYQIEFENADRIIDQVSGRSL